MLMLQYFELVMKDPNNINDLIDAMSKESRVSIEVYEKMYSIFDESDYLKNYYFELFERNAIREFDFY